MYKKQRIINAIDIELARAKQLHPVFPDDLIHQVAIMSEESGEAMQAALNCFYHGGSIDDVKDELIQTAAMCIRCLENMGDK